MTDTSNTRVHVALIMVAAAIAMFMASLDGTIVTIALPTIAQTFSLSSTDVEWVSTGYLLVTAGTMLIAGKLADIFGYKKLFILGFIVFTIGSLFCGLLPILLDSYSMLLVCRVIQALGAVMMLVIAPTLISSYLPAESQGKGMSIITLFASLGIALGPTLGGIITENLSWSWVFFINVPVGIIAVILSLKALPREPRDPSKSMKGFDGIGAALVFIGIASLLFLISEGAVLGWTSLPIILAAVLTILGIGGFILREKKAKSPIFDISMFRNRTFTLAIVIFSITFFVFGGAFFLMPFYLELVQHMGSTQAGLILSVLSVGMLIAGVVTGFLYAKFIGKNKYLIAIGLALLAVGFFLLSKLNPVSGMGIVLVGLTCLGLGIGAISTLITTLLLGNATSERKSMVSSLITLARTGVMPVGISVFNLLMITGVKYLTTHAPIADVPIMQVFPEILSKGFDFCFIIGLALAIVVFILSFFLREHELKQ